MTIDPKRERERARWRRNKRVARAKAKAPKPTPSPKFVALVMAERDLRASTEARLWLFEHPQFAYWSSRGWRYWVRMHHGNWTAFIADVWAARTLLEKQYGVGTATPTGLPAGLLKMVGSNIMLSVR